MENPRGIVIAVDRVEPSPHALVQVDATISCARCAEGKGCGAGLLGGNAGPRRVDALVSSGLTIDEGDEVRIELAPTNLLRASMIVYGLPLTGAVAGALISHLLGLGDLYAAITGLGGVIVGLYVARLRLRASSCLRKFTPTITERLSAGR